MIPRINFTFKENKELKNKINKLKDTINQMSTTFGDSYSKQFYQNLKKKMLDLQIQLIENK